MKKKYRPLMSWGWERREEERKWRRLKFFAIILLTFFCGFLSGSSMHTVEMKVALATTGFLLMCAVAVAAFLAFELFKQEPRP